MKKIYIHLAIILSFVTILSCEQKTSAPNPWGTTDDAASSDTILGLEDIISNGELIMVTMSGPDTYYEYHGRGMGLHYMLLEEFCQHEGVALRVDICKDTTEMISRVQNGEADIVAMPFKEDFEGLENCLSNASGNKWHWLVNQANVTLAEELEDYMTAGVIKRVTEQQSMLLASATVKRHVYSPMLNRSKGIISNYDYLFQRYAPVAGWDWHLMAAQCYQESCFDPRARSWAGAAGLMQIMPSTADQLGLPRSQIYDPEQNVAHAAKYIAQLTNKFSDIGNPTERIKFVLASYNGGSYHVRDAMALAKKYGKSPYSWDNVREYILGLQSPQYYNDPVVKSGYMRGSETADYVDKIIARWMGYRGVKGGAAPVSGGTMNPSVSPGMPAPHPSAKRKDKYNI